MYDLVVAGGGPVGLATALYAARAGLSTVVLDPRAAPIDKACGEGLLPAAVRDLRELDIDLGGYPFRGIRYADGTRRVDALFRSGHGLGLRRTDLHAALDAAVRDRGIAVLRRSAGAITQDATSVYAGGVRGRYLAAADGLHSPVRRALGLDRPPGDRRQNHGGARPAPRFGQRRHYAVAPWSDVVEVHWARAGEAYVTPVGPDLVGVAILSSERTPFAGQLAAFPAVSERVAGADASRVRGAGPLRQQARRRVAGRVLLVGDAAGYVDALTGEGIAVGVACARQLVACVVADQPDAYEREWRRASRRYRLITSTLLWARRRPHLGRAIVPAAVGAPRLFTAAVEAMAR